MFCVCAHFQQYYIICKNLKVLYFFISLLMFSSFLSKETCWIASTQNLTNMVSFVKRRTNKIPIKFVLQKNLTVTKTEIQELLLILGFCLTSIVLHQYLLDAVNCQIFACKIVLPVYKVFRWNYRILQILWTIFNFNIQLKIPAISMFSLFLLRNMWHVLPRPLYPCPKTRYK